MSIVHLHICVGENSELDFEIFSEAFSFWILESEGSNMVVLVGGDSWLDTIFNLKWNNNASVLEWRHLIGTNWDLEIFKQIHYFFAEVRSQNCSLSWRLMSVIHILDLGLDGFTIGSLEDFLWDWNNFSSLDQLTFIIVTQGFSLGSFLFFSFLFLGLSFFFSLILLSLSFLLLFFSTLSLLISQFLSCTSWESLIWVLGSLLAMTFNHVIFLVIDECKHLQIVVFWLIKF